MDKITIDGTVLGDAIDNADVDVTVHRDYSGRGMCGETCFGLVTSEPGAVFRILIELGMLVTDLARDLTGAMRTDNMGLGYIAYFPGYTYDGTTGYEEDEDWM